MRRQRKSSRGDQTAEAPAALGLAPLVALGLFSLAVRSADSSAAFRVDQDRVLEALKRRIAEASTQAVGDTEVLDVPAPEVDEHAAPPAAAAPYREVHETVRRGDTFGGILRRIGVSSREVSRWSAASRRHVSLTRLVPGHAFTFLVPSGTDELAGLQYEISAESVLVMRADGEEVVAQVERVPRMTATRVASGIIDSNLYASASRAGVPDSVISGLVDIFGWDVDFSSDVQAGDSFRVAFEESRDIAGGRAEGGRVIAAELTVRGKRWDAVFFEADDDGGNYYSSDGRPLGRSFLRYPVEYTRISSQFTTSRFHPVLRRRRPHLGVDFAAPIGTPVRAIAGGRVEAAGWKGGSGRYIKISHGSGIDSSYSHLHSIDSDVRPGARVQIGQVIGTVGASGLATGPHLHFALYRDGTYVNPMSVKLPAAPPLDERYMPDFARVRTERLAQLARAPLEPAPGAAIEVASVEAEAGPTTR